MKENIRKYCRLCANKVQKDLIPIFDTQGLSNEIISDRINTCLPVSVFDDDGLPQQICLPCKKKLNISYDLSQCSVLAEEKLRQIKFETQYEEENEIQESMSQSCGINAPSTSVADSMYSKDFFGNSVTKEVVPVLPARGGLVQDDQIVEKSSVTAVIVAEKFKKINPKLRVVLVPKDDSKLPIAQRVATALKAYKQKIQAKKIKLVKPVNIDDLSIRDDNNLECAPCKLNFDYLEGKKEHFMVSHPEQIFNCLKCNETVFGSQEIIKKHIEMHELPQTKDNNKETNQNTSNNQENDASYDPATMVINLGEYNPNLTKKNAALQRLKILTKATDHPGIKNDIKQQVLAALSNFLSNDQPHAISQQLGREPPVSETQCRICFRKCTKISTLQKHLMQSHKPKVDVPKCEHCDRILPLYGTEQHIKKKHSTGKHLQCCVCDTEYSKTGLEQPHMFLAPQIPCVVSTCSEHFSTVEKVANHAYHVHKIFSYNCEFCGKGFRSNISMASHLLSKHLQTEPNICEICEKSFTTLAGLNTHKKNMHTHQEQCVCDMCGKIVPKYALKSHIHNHFYYSQVRECESCHKMLKIKAWHRHRKFHAKNGPDSVVKRGKVTRKHDGVVAVQKLSTPRKQTKTVHSKEKEECKVCHRMYLRRSLKAHMKHHLNLKDFACALCDKKYVSRNTLTSHIQEIHLKVGHHCQYCKKYFYRKGSVLAHEALHRGERDFKCPMCPKTFPGQRNVYSHMWQVHNNAGKKKISTRKVPKIEIIPNNILAIHTDEYGHDQLISMQGDEYLIPDVIVNIDTKTCEVTFNKQYRN